MSTRRTVDLLDYSDLQLLRQHYLGRRSVKETRVDPIDSNVP